MRLSTTLLSLVCSFALIGCTDDSKDDGSDPGEVGTTGSSGTTGGGPSGPQDADGDGVLSDEDCDDGNPDIHPGAVESCNGVDDDCDGSVDEGEPSDGATWYADADGDGYGDPDNTVTACARPDGWTGDNTDCNDALETIHPGAPEVCNEVDDDCDGLLDADDPDAAGGTTWYADTDGDGYGDPGAATVSCEAPADHVLDNQDCDDTSPSVSPAGVEACNGVDDDCDDLTDTEDSDLVDGLTIYPDFDEDGYGDASGAMVSCTVLSGFTTDSADCDDTSALISPDATETCNGVDDDCDSLVDDDDTAVTGTTAFYVDGDGDGYGGTGTVAACIQPSGATLASTDCDDADSTISPGATETCNGIDDDCDSLVDDADDAVSGTTTWYYDGDGDGAGSTAATVDACDQPTDYAATSTDCDDADAAIHPAADEACNGYDDDCDGLVDDADTITDPSGLTAFYTDADSDGYGVAGSSTLSCEAPSGMVDNTDDCDDTDASVSPAATETCNSVDDDCDGLVDDDDSAVTGTTTWYADSDGDGYGNATSTTDACAMPSDHVSDSTDCDDTDSAISPAATETCNGEDDDCDGDVDDADSSVTGTTTWYADADSDGYGGATISTVSCDAPSGFVDDSSDCDDTLSTVRPDADETCNTLDDDCDGLVDDDDTVVDLASLTAFYADADGDGYGLSTSTTTACEAPSGYADMGGDCDDTDSAISPGAIEVCNSVDDDCDGDIDADDDSASGVAVYYPDVDGDGYGDEDLGAAACSSPGSGYITAGGDCEDADATVSPAETEVCGDGLDNDCSGGDQSCSTGGSTGGGAGTLYTVDTLAFASIQGLAQYDDVGQQVAAAGDLDGDGSDDLLLGIDDKGKAYVYLGPLSGSHDYTDADITFTGERSTGDVGWNVLHTGDVDQDGQDDIMLGGRYDYHSSISSNGGVYLWNGPVTGGTFDYTTADVQIEGSGTRDYLGGLFQNVGDVNGDGITDLLIGGRGAHPTKSSSYYYGAVFLFHGPVTSGTELDAVAYLEGDYSYGYVGERKADGRGDIDGDGFSDLLVSQYGEETFHVLFGPVTGSGDLSAVADLTIVGSSSGATGQVLGFAGDLDGDGLDDIYAGDPYFDYSSSETNSGRVFVWYGPMSAASSAAQLADARFQSARKDDLLGYDVAVPGDLDGDGALDLVMGAYGDDDLASNAGAAYIVTDTPSGTYDLDTDFHAKVVGAGAGDELGWGMGAVGDLDGDGIDDLGLGAPGENTVAYDAGVLYLLSGTGW